MRIPSNLLAVAFVAVFVSTHAVLAGSSNSLMDISRDGRLLACSNRDSGTVTIVSLPDHQVLREVAVGRHPEGVSFVGQSHNVAVAVYDDDRVVVLDADSGSEVSRTDVFDEPYGIVSLRDGSRLFVTLEYPGQIVEIDPADGSIIRAIDAGKFPRGIALTPDESRLLICEYLTAGVRAFDLKSGKQVDEWFGASTDNLARQLVVHPRRPKAYLGFIRSIVTAHQGAGSIFPYVGILDIDPQPSGRDELRRKRNPMDSFVGARVTANPWEVDISPDGRNFYVVFSGTDDMFVVRTIDDDYREIEPVRHLRLGKNPRAVRVTPDGARFYVYNALDFQVVAYDATSNNRIATIDVTKNPLPADVHLGKVLFYTALPPMTSRLWISCSSCHPDGQPDGRTWHNPEGLRQTPSLAGLAWTHPQHWSADRDETQDFEHTIRGPLMGGRGLARGRINPSLGKTNKGLSDSLDALAAYTNSHRFPLSPYAKKGLTDAARRGREIFFSKQTRCAECHSGPFLTDSQSGRKSKRHDVGTGQQDDSETMGPAYDTPTLLGLYRTAPYLHHGTAATLRDVLTTANPDDRHGKTSHLTGQQINDLTEFLKSLPYEAPEKSAPQAGLIPVRN
ncbi:MAG: beta-propeller fold lactonase family protein [Planctomycetota bacterium]